MAVHHVLIIDDDPGLSNLLSEYLGSRGLRVTCAADGPDGLRRWDTGAFDLIVLDVMMPGMDGFEVLRAIRAKGRTPVIMLTARGDELDRIVGLELGADDYLSKPFNPRELLARIHAVLRRSASIPESDAPLQAAGLRLHPARREAFFHDQPIPLTTTEYDILRVLVAAAGRVVPRERLMELARGEDWAAYERSVDVHVSHIRRKLGDNPKAPTVIKTIRGIGYLIPRDTS